MIDTDKRNRVMARSMRLGHCICDPKKPCPCDVFTHSDVCLCAGETLPVPVGPVRLTRLVQYAGCASKIDEITLKRILSGLPSTEDKNVIVGVAAGDDAGVYRLKKGLALVQTVDVFCPSVDDPYTFGLIAAANSVSDIYAMGGTPLTALSILGFPIRSIPDSVMHTILRGGLDKMKEAGVSVIGGHSINDPEIKAGFAVTGLIDEKKIMTNAAARPGDLLILTKPIGTGIISFAGQIDRAPRGSLESAAASMAALNKTASELMLAARAHACTDVTGFGLLGHLSELAERSRVDVEIAWDDIPLLPGVLECIAAGIIPGGVERNRESSAEHVKAGAGVTSEMLDVCFDPQTSGGLLIAVAPRAAEKLIDKLHNARITSAAVIGKVSRAGSGRVVVKTRGKRTFPSRSDSLEATAPAPSSSYPEAAEVNGIHSDEGGYMSKRSQDKSCCAAPQGSACCAGGNAPGPEASNSAAGGEVARSEAAHNDVARGEGVRESMKKLGEFSRAVSTPGALDARTKKAIAIALSVLSRCAPCAKAHIAQARADGFSQEEIDEAAMMGVLFGGSPAMIFYEGVKHS
jgi:selenide,water dikinase